MLGQGSLFGTIGSQTQYLSCCISPSVAAGSSSSIHTHICPLVLQHRVANQAQIRTDPVWCNRKQIAMIHSCQVQIANALLLLHSS